MARLSADAPNVDVHADGEPLTGLRDVACGTISSYLALPWGTHNVEEFATEKTSQPLIEAQLDLRDDA